MHRRIHIVLTIVFALALALPAVAHAAAASTPTTPPAKSKSTTQTYDLSFTLPTIGRSGCQVCHADPNLVKINGTGGVSSMYVDPEEMAEGPHAKVACTGCHIDFAYKTPHKDAVKNDWRAVAKDSCKNCHTQEGRRVNEGAHTSALTEAQKKEREAKAKAEGKPLKVPLCGDCHGGHDIPKLDTNAAKKAFHATALEMCGECHAAEAGTYDDYYHGAAYRRGAPDAPACWQCHKAHDVLPSTDPKSPTNPDNLPTTCGQCHKAATLGYTQYAKAIHGSEQVRADNPAYSFIYAVRQRVWGAVDTVASWFGK